MMKDGWCIRMRLADWKYLWKTYMTPWVPRLGDTDVPWRNPIWDLSDALCLVYEDGYPVTEGHLLFVPRFDDAATIAYTVRKAAGYGLAMRRDSDWDGFNIGMNCGAAAGQTVWWPHVHLIPRRDGDVEDPTGGVRNVIAGQGNYHLPNYKRPIC